MSKNSAYTLGILFGSIIGIASGCFFFYYTDSILVITGDKVFSDYIPWSPYICLLIPIFFALYYGIKAGAFLDTEYSPLTCFLILLKLTLENLLVALVQWLILIITAVIICIIVVDPLIYFALLVAVLLVIPPIILLVIKLIDLL